MTPQKVHLLAATQKVHFLATPQKLHFYRPCKKSTFERFFLAEIQSEARHLQQKFARKTRRMISIHECGKAQKLSNLHQSTIIQKSTDRPRPSSNPQPHQPESSMFFEPRLSSPFSLVAEPMSPKLVEKAVAVPNVSRRRTRDSSFIPEDSCSARSKTCAHEVLQRAGDPPRPSSDALSMPASEGQITPLSMPIEERNYPFFNIFSKLKITSN